MAGTRPGHGAGGTPGSAAVTVTDNDGTRVTIALTNPATTQVTEGRDSEPDSPSQAWAALTGRGAWRRVRLAVVGPSRRGTSAPTAPRRTTGRS